MNWEGLINSTTAVVVALTALVVAIAGLLAALKKARDAINSIKGAKEELTSVRAGLQQTNLVVGQLSSQSPNADVAAAGKTLPKPDGALVIRWAQQHNAPNAWDMGPKNWERCLYDLGYPGGKAHQLEFNNDGTLKYQ
jgi:hypothetical protein